MAVIGIFDRIRREDYDEGFRELRLGEAVVEMRKQAVPWALIITLIMQAILAWLESREPKPPA